MDAIKFFEEAGKLCNTLKNCSDCPLCNCICGLQYDEVTDTSVAKTIDIVEKWASENPKKTHKSEFLKMFPRVIERDGIIGILPCSLDSNYKNIWCKHFDTCQECMRAYWLAEVE